MLYIQLEPISPWIVYNYKNENLCHYLNALEKFVNTVG